MKIAVFISFIFNISYNLFSQEEGISSLLSNPYIVKTNNHLNKNNEKSSSSSFDSTFIYYTDTLTLPFFDEFSKNKFQQYNSNFTDPGVTSIKKFHLLNNITDIQLSKDSTYTTQATFRRTYSIDHLTHTDSPLPSSTIKIGSLTSYPINYVSTVVYPPYYIYDSLENPTDISDTIWIISPDITQDSATQFFKSIIDPNKLWIDNNAYHNYRFASNPWSIGVATFDGLDENGHPYQPGSLITNYGDYLTSKPIDLSLNTASDSIYLSFLYQSGGFGETPDASDSLVLEFYVRDLDQWMWIWSTNGSINTDFNVGHICIKNAQYFKKDFQFRFKNYGQLSGDFDVFNLDYVNLRTLSGQQDTLFKDFAWVYPITTLLKDYTSVPWDHYKNNFSGKMSSNVNLVIRNGSNIPENNSIPGKIYVEYNNLLENSFAITGNSLSNNELNYAPRTNYSTFHDLSTGYHFDENKTGTKASFKIIGTAASQFPNFNQNDSTFSTQYFGNYYSYDDGSAEAAYGCTGTQSELAVKFISYESDSIIGIMTNFVETAYDVSNKLFLLTVWNDNNGIPGDIIYQDETFFPRSPIYPSSNNGFYTYYFNNDLKVKVSGPFYIGWKQFDAQRLNIGFDKNIVTNSNNFYSNNSGSTWNNSQIEGSIMMRPVFSTAMDNELGVTEKKINNSEIVLFPNPSSGLISIRNTSQDFKGFEIYSLQGKLLLSTKDTEIDLSNYPEGVYLFKTLDSKNKIYKVIKY